MVTILFRQGYIDHIPGTMIDAKEFYIYVNGTLIGDNATIFSSTPSKIGDVSNAYSPGVWNGLFIGNSGHAILII